MIPLNFLAHSVSVNLNTLAVISSLLRAGPVNNTCVAGLGQIQSAEAAAAWLQSSPCQLLDTVCSGSVLQPQFYEFKCILVFVEI